MSVQAPVHDPATPVIKRPRHIQWAWDIFGHATLPDERLKKRAVKFLVDKVQHPSRSVNGSCRDAAAAKGAYRLLSNERVQPEHLWEPYFDYSAQVCAEFASFYAVHDATCLSYLRLHATTGLGTATLKEPHYLWKQSCLALRRNGQALGLLHAHLWARPVEEFKAKADHHTRPIEDKESYEWIRGVEAVAALQAQHFPTSRPIHIMDIGGDIHEVYETILRHGHGCIIRCGYNRGVEGAHRYLHDTVAAQPVRDTADIDLPRHDKVPARVAHVELRSVRVTVRLSANKHKGRQPYEINVLRVTEPEPPPGVEAVDWILCTTEPIDTVQECWAVVEGYKLRWRIEDYHLVLKSGCHAEKTQLKTAERIMRLMPFLCFVAVRILALRDHARTEPDAPCTVVLDAEEWPVLWSYVHGRAVPRGHPPPTLQEAVLMIGRLGGHLGRAGDAMPGVRSLWRGMYDLELILIGYRLAELNR